MRIGLVVTGGVDRSGRERVVPALLTLVERLARRHELHVFVLHHEAKPSTYPLLGATVHDVGRVERPPGLRLLRQRAKLAAAIDDIGQFDVLHAYLAMPAGFLTTRVAIPRRTPTLVTFDSGEFVALDDIEYGLQRRWIDRRAIGVILQSANRLTVPTEFMRRLASFHGVLPDVVPLGVDPLFFVPQPRPDGPPWRLLRVASLNRVKDYPMLLYALRRIVDRGIGVHLDIVGEDTLAGSTQRLTSELGLDAQVTFHGFQPSDRLRELYARANIHVISSRHEAASVVALEAACAGVPTIGTSVGYVADWNPDCAIGVPVGDSRALADAIVALLEDPVRRNRIVTAARAWALAHDADWTRDRFDRIYTELVHPT